MTDDELIQCFEAGTPPPGGFHHEQHVRAAWCYLRRHPCDVALERFRSGLRHFAEAQGAPNRYHETITTAFVLLIANRLGDLAADTTWAGFASRNADLLAWKPSILDRYYRSATLASDRARQTFVPPDLAAWSGVGTGPSAPRVTPRDQRRRSLSQNLPVALKRKVARRRSSSFTAARQRALARLRKGLDLQCSEALPDRWCMGLKVNGPPSSCDSKTSGELWIQENELHDVSVIGLQPHRIPVDTYLRTTSRSQGTVGDRVGV